MFGLFKDLKDHDALERAAVELTLVLRCNNCPMFDPVDDCRGWETITDCKQRILEELYQDADIHILSKTREFLESKIRSENEMKEVWERPSRPSRPTAYPQDQEANEYRYFDPAWLDAIAEGLTKGAVKHPGETWRQIPADEHLARALRHINLYRKGDRNEPHIINASMRLMMAFATAREDET